MAQARKRKIIKVIAIIVTIMLTFSNVVSAGIGRDIGRGISSTTKFATKELKKHMKEKQRKQEQKEKREKDKKNEKYLKIRGKVYRGQKLTKDEETFWKECIERLKGKQVEKFRKQYQEENKKEAPKWKQYGSKLFGEWMLNLSEQPEWQEDFYKRLPQINEDAFEVPEEYKEFIELPNGQGGILIHMPAPAPMPLPIVP